MNTKTDSGIDYSTRMPARERMISSATYPSLPVLLRTMAMRPTNLTPGGCGGDDARAHTIIRAACLGDCEGGHDPCD